MAKDKVLGLWTATDGSRVRPVGLVTPTTILSKALLRAKGKPIGEIQQAQMYQWGDFEGLHIIAIGRDNRIQLGDRFKDGRGYATDGKYIPITYSPPGFERRNRGSAGAVIKNLKWLKETGALKNMKYAVWFPNDNLFEMDFPRLLDAHKKTGALVTVLDIPMNPFSTIGAYGLLQKDANHRVTEFIEKPNSSEELLQALGKTDPAKVRDSREPVNTGAYIISIDHLLEVAEQNWMQKQLKGQVDMGGDFLPAAVEKDLPIYAQTIDDWADFGGAQLILDSAQRVLRGEFQSVDSILDADPHYQKLDGNVHVHVGSLGHKNKHTGRTLEQMMTNGDIQVGPNTFIGRNVNIDPEALVANTDLQKNCHVGRGAKVNSSYIMPGVQIGDYAVVDDVGLGFEVRIESSKRKPTRINGRSIVGPDITIPVGTILDDCVVWPGYNGWEQDRNENNTISGKVLIPDEETQLKEFQRLYPKQ